MGGNPAPEIRWYHIEDADKPLLAAEQKAIELFQSILGIVQPGDVPPELLDGPHVEIPSDDESEPAVSVKAESVKDEAEEGEEKEGEKEEKKKPKHDIQKNFFQLHQI